MKLRTAHDPPSVATSNGLPHLSPHQHELLKSALGLKAPDDRSTADVRPAIREIVSTCAPAQRPEQVLVAFKNSLDEIARTARIPFGPERSVQLSSMVTVFIEEMYARGPAIRDGACRGK